MISFRFFEKTNLVRYLAVLLMALGVGILSYGATHGTLYWSGLIAVLASVLAFIVSQANPNRSDESRR